MKPLIIGIGNRHRGDDAIGPVLVDQLKQTAKAIDTAYCAGDLTRLLDIWQGRKLVILIDMLVTADAPPGGIHHFDVQQDSLPYEIATSSHAMNLSQCIELARTLEQLPPRLELIGVVGAQTTPGAELSPVVQDAIGPACHAVVQRLPTEADSHA